MKELKNSIGYIILAIAALIVIVVVWNRAEEAMAPHEDPITEAAPAVSETELPDFARIEMRDGERVLVNERDRYELTLENNWKPEYYTNVIEIFVEDDYPSGELTASFLLIDNPLQELSLEKWVERKLRIDNEDCSNCYEFEDYFDVDDVRVARIFDRAGMGGNRYTFLFIKNDTLYSLSTANLSETNINQIIRDLKSI